MHFRVENPEKIKITKSLQNGDFRYYAWQPLVEELRTLISVDE
jgi:hypothetical protein